MKGGGGTLSALRPDEPAAGLYTVVIPTVGRPSLERTLEALTGCGQPRTPATGPAEMLLVDDRANRDTPLFGPGTLPVGAAPVRVLASGGRGPAAARNVGWRAALTPWVVFLDDDVVPGPGWADAVTGDLTGLPADVAGSQGRIRVPPPSGRGPTDTELATVALSDALWITADMAYRRSALTGVGGFDAAFRRAYREDTDLALRLLDRGHRLVRGDRVTVHPLRGGGAWASVVAQRGNADDALMRRRHGAHWRRRVGEERGRFRAHAATTAALVLTGVRAAYAARRDDRRATALAAVSGAVWAALTADFAARRIARASGTSAENLRLLLTSAAIPPVACWYRVLGEVRHRRERRPGESGGGGRGVPQTRPAAVLFDRDGTLLHDVAYNGDPGRVVPVAGARQALERLRGRGVPIGVVSNQSGVARGLFSPEDLEKVNTRVEELLGPFDVWRLCVHGEEEGCVCRKPRPGLVEQAAAFLRVSARSCVVIGDTGDDVAAAATAGARPILVPNESTRTEERRAAPEVAGTLAAAVELALRG